MKTVDAEKLLDELRTLVAGTEHLLDATAADVSSGVVQARRELEQTLTTVRQSVHRADEYLLRRIRVGARTADRYVHVNPWNAVGVAAGFGFLAGCLAVRR